MDETDFVISEKFHIKNSDINKIYQKSVEWFSKKKASIIEKNEPFYLKAYHIGWLYESAYKTKYMVINLTQEDTDTIVEFKIPALPSVRGPAYWVNWWPLLRDFCDYIGIDRDESMKHIKELVARAGLIW